MERSLSRAKEGPGTVRDRGVDPVFLLLVLVTLAVGLVMLYSASSAQSEFDSGYTSSTRYLVKQAVCAVLGLGAMALTARLDAEFWRRCSVPLYVGSVILLLLVLVMGSSVNGARRWISIGGIRFQPSEIAKFTMIVLFSRLSEGFGSRVREFRYGVAGFGAALLGLLIPLALEKHLSAILLMGMVAVTMMFISGTRLRYLAMGAAGALAFVGIYVSLMGYAGDRISAWLHPELDPGDTGYQILQSLYAIGSGGLFGLGLGKSRQKYLYLPFQYNDYIFAIACEELGLVGAVGIIALFAALILRGYWIALHARDRFSCLLAAGLVSLIAIQTVLNLCVVSNILPSTGISLPLFSYGGTALAMNLSELGVILSISRHRFDARKQEEDI